VNLGHWEPIHEYAMTRVSPVYTICETIRLIYNRTDDTEIKYLCRIATTMAKHMVKKLEEYNEKFNDETWLDKTEDVVKELNERT
jgi:hypothetical protein